MAILPILAMFFMALKGFVYTIAVYIYGIYLAFSIKTHCILQQIAVHLAANSPKCGANGGFCK